MIVILSPAKNMRPGHLDGLKITRPRHLEKTRRLNALLKTYDPWELESLLSINPKLAINAWSNYHDMDLNRVGTPALLAYNGLAYHHLFASDFTLEDFHFAAEHLRILSAFYGVLRPSDGILPYRLQLQCKLKVDGKSLYAFWADMIYQDLFQTGQAVINLCSQEYAKTVSPYLLENDTFITCRFLSRRAGRLCCTATNAKMARGQMARYIIKNHITSPRELRSFDWNGYVFSQALSNSTEYVFIQP